MKYRYLNKQQRAAIKNDIYVGFTNQAVYDHLVGKASYGIYLIVDENQCYLVTLDFDKEGYQETCSSVASTAKEYGFPISSNDHNREKAVTFGSSFRVRSRQKKLASFAQACLFKR